MSTKKDLYGLIHHLRACPAEFLQLDAVHGDIRVMKALLCDLFRTVYGDFTLAQDRLPSLHELDVRYYKENESLSIQIGIWFFHHPLFVNNRKLPDPIKEFLLIRLPVLSKYVDHKQWLDDEDRTEEFIREALQSCKILIDDETPAEAHDRLEALSTLKRQKVITETNESLERMKKIRQKMAEQKAREAANVYGRE